MRFFKFIAAFSAILLLINFSCKKTDSVILGPANVRNSDKLKLYFNDSVFVLRQENQTASSLVVNWNASSKGTPGSASYKLLIDKDQSFANPSAIVSDGNTFSTAFTVKALNKIIIDAPLALPADSNQKVKLYLKMIAITNTANDTSGVYSVTVTPYVPHFVLTKELYIVGSAVGTLLQAQLALPMYADSTTKIPGSFYWVGYIADTGTFKFITSPALGLYPAYSKRGDNTHLSYYDEKPAAGSETLFTVPAAGIYSITAHLTDSTVEMHQVDKIPILDADDKFLSNITLLTDSVYPWLPWQTMFDGDKNTYIDDAYGDTKPWGALEFSDPVDSLALIRYMPRPEDWAAPRMVGGVFQGANKSDFSDSAVLYRVNSVPKYNAWNYASIDVKKKFKYIRYVAPLKSGVNVAEVEYYKR